MALITRRSVSIDRKLEAGTNFFDLLPQSSEDLGVHVVHEQVGIRILQLPELFLQRQVLGLFLGTHKVVR